MAEIYNSFERLMETEILPKRNSNPEDMRLDGLSSGGNREVAGRFRYDNKVWKVNADSHYEPLILAYEAIKKDPSCRPFVEEPTSKGSSLVLIEGLRKRMTSDRFKHLYIYEDTSGS